MEEWIEEFLYRGRPPSGPGSELAPAWHVVIGQQADSPFNPQEKQRRTVVMSVEQAEAAGWPLSAVLAEINVATLNRIVELEAENVVKANQIDNLSTQVAQMTKQIEALSQVEG